MRNGLFIAFLLLLAPSIARAAAAVPGPTPAPAPTSSPRLTAVAPADTYFGPFGMSPLSIRSTIGLLGRQYHYRTINDHDLLRKALITENALRIWRTKYPADPWLPPTFFHLEQLYQAVQTDESRKHATAILKDVVRAYPSTKEGRLSRLRLAAGFPPLIPETPLVATPSPAESAATPPTDATAPQSSPTGGIVPPASATPAAAPTKTPAATTSPVMAPVTATPVAAPAMTPAPRSSPG